MARRSILVVIGPGLLVAATGIGAGDLVTGAFSGNLLGVAVLWAVVLGAGFKFVLTEGLARWQLVTGETVLEGALRRLGRPARWLFVLYLLPWTFFVGSALMGACGVTANAIAPIFENQERAKLVLGVAHSALGLGLVLLGGFRLFERVMGACIALMFATVVTTAALLRPDVAALLRGLFTPVVPDAGGEGIGWTVALIGGVGGTLTILCYGYWIREQGRFGVESIRTCRIDLAVGYGLTALFGIGMVVLGSSIQVEDLGAGLIVAIAARLDEVLGPVARWSFLIGAWCAVFSSLLGVWQAVPYVFADFWRLAAGGESPAVDTAARPYRLYLYGLASVPALGLAFDFRSIQKIYAVVGACFLPVLALTLLLLNRRGAWTGAHHDRPATRLVLVGILAFFVLAGWLKLR
ncbi:MAG: Nramp family divalent metal transporter [Planctomycetota bacterium]|nr:Nramp family divalent metal transporter [Planctomycetota bacterium]